MKKVSKCPQTKLSRFELSTLFSGINCRFMRMWVKKETNMHTIASYSYWFWTYPLSIWSICSINLWLAVDLLLFWQNVHIFSHKCPRTRFARFKGFFMSGLAYHTSYKNCLIVSWIWSIKPQVENKKRFTMFCLMLRYLCPEKLYLILFNAVDRCLILINVNV